MRRIPLDAVPDISDVQVIIRTTWDGQPPNIIEDQVTYPIVTALLSAPKVRIVRALTMFGDSYVFVIFEDGTDLYWARSRVIRGASHTSTPSGLWIPLPRRAGLHHHEEDHVFRLRAGC
jgi:Cu/Ag efflux pump CusA